MIVGNSNNWSIWKALIVFDNKALYKDQPPPNRYLFAREPHETLYPFEQLVQAKEIALELQSQLNRLEGQLLL